MTQYQKKSPKAPADNLHINTKPKTQQNGLTMVELLVALVISMLIALAAIAALTVTRQGFSSVDASSQLRDNGRFSADLIQRLAIQSGFKDLLYAATPPTLNVVNAVANPDPNISGFNNALLDSSNPLNAFITRTTGIEGYGSDLLILRYQVNETFPGSGVADGSMIGCTGTSPSAIPTSRYTRMVSILHVAISQGEPSLMCSFSATGTTPFTTQPIVQGIENFQVLYGTDGVTAGTAPPVSAASAAAITDVVPDRFLRADQMVVAGDAVGTNANWRRVRSLRIGLVLRGPLNSSQEKISQTYYPFGAGKSSSTGTVGSAMSSSNDPGTVFTSPVDGRLRQVVTFTVHLRNDQGL